jgi:hypothetical protein
MRTPATVIRGVFVSFIVLGLIFISIINASGSAATQGELAIADETPPPLLKLYLPMVFRDGMVELNGAWINNADGLKQYGFEPGAKRQFVVELNNQSGSETLVNLTWDLDGFCEQKLLMNETIVLKPGVSHVIREDNAPDCFGVTTNSILLSFGGKMESEQFNSVVINPSSVIVATNQGFDNCTLPTVSQMQTWWDHSPYSTINIYLGGVSAACPMNRDAGWLYDVSQQGWSFILTWVGPQASCTSYNHRMSSNPATAKQQGRDNADAAVATARQKGFLGDLVIYYDLESFSKGLEDAGCRAAADSFLQGWSERIHELGEYAGAYGTPCTSYISDWADNNNPPDDVWIANWNTVYEYDPTETVWDIPCLSNNLWKNSQRLKQYTGGHKETWGGLQKSIDSNVLEGQVSAILDVPLPASSQTSPATRSAPEIIKVSEPPIADFQLLSNQAGWVLRGGQLFWTEDGGSSWTPAGGTGGEILDVHFFDTHQGWLVSKHVVDGTINLLQSRDSGQSWQEVSTLLYSPEEVYQIASASLEFTDAGSGYLAFKLHSSSNFSLGRLFATNDGGLTWEERALPLGEPVTFLDARHGWTKGGPQDRAYYTADGGLTWNLTGSLPDELTLDAADSSHPPKALSGFESNQQSLVKLQMFDNQTGWAIVQDGSCSGYKPRAGEIVPQGSPGLQCESSTRLMMTGDGGRSWQDISPTH